MKTPKNAPSREYQYRLFATERVACGPEVAEFIHNTSGGVIGVEFAGDVDFVPELGAPIKKEAAKDMFSGKLFSDGFSIVLLNDDLWNPIFWYDGHAVVSRSGISIGAVTGPDLPIYAYLTLVAIAGNELISTGRSSFLMSAVSELGPFRWEEAIKSGRLLGDMHNLLEKAETRIGPEFTRALIQVLRVIAMQSSDVRAVPSSEADPSQQPPEVTEGSEMPAESSASEFMAEPDDQIKLYAEQFAEIIKRGGLPAGVEILQDIEYVLAYSSAIRVEEIRDDLINERPEALSNLISLIADCDHPSADRLLHTMAAAGDPVLATAAQKALAKRKLEQGRTPDTDDDSVTVTPEPISAVGGTVDPTVKITSAPTPETASTGRFGFDSDSEAPIDALDYQGYAKALATTICDSATGMPFTLGICAPWGRGKTALMRFVKEEIKAINRSVKGSPKPAKEDKRCAEIIDFNAWRYSKSNAVWAAFLGVIVSGIEGGLGFRKKFSFRLFVTRKAHPIRFAGWIAGVVILAAILVIKGPALVNYVFSDQTEKIHPPNQIITVVEDNPPFDTTATLYIREPKSESESSSGIGSIEIKDAMTVITTLVTVISTLMGWLWPLSRGILGKVRKGGRELPPQAQEDVLQYLALVSKWLERQVKQPKGTDDQKPSSSLPFDRFVVFIDDIDRVEPDKVLLLMEAIKLFQDTERFIFVLAMDTRVVRHAIGKHYEFMCKTAKDREEMGRFYLEKMIQVPFHLPALTAEKRRQLGDSIIIKYLEEEPEPKEAPVIDDRITEAIETNGEAAPSLARETVYTTPDISSPEPAPAEQEPSAPLSEPKLPGPIEDVRLRITPTEYRIIDEIMNTDGFEISPRLIKRFINVYMMARHILIMQLASKSGSGSGFVPHPSFIRWLAVSVLHPFEASALTKWLADNSWADPLDNTFSVFEDSGRFCYKERPDDPPPRGRAREDQEPFTHLKLQELSRFGFILSQWDMDWSEVEKTLHITNLFNLVLE